MCIKTFYILPLLSGIKSIENIFFLTPADENGALTRFTPCGVKRVIDPFLSAGVRKQIFSIDFIPESKGSI